MRNDYSPLTTQALNAAARSAQVATGNQGLNAMLDHINGMQSRFQQWQVPEAMQNSARTMNETATSGATPASFGRLLAETNNPVTGPSVPKPNPGRGRGGPHLTH